MILAPSRPHDPGEREVIGQVSGWEIRQFSASDAKLSYFTGRGFLHVQLWHPGASVSVLTPSRLTGGCFEVWTPEAGRSAVVRWEQVARLVRGVALPGSAEVAAVERWFVLRNEPAEVHLLRTWWSSLPRASRKA